MFSRRIMRATDGWEYVKPEIVKVLAAGAAGSRSGAEVVVLEVVVVVDDDAADECGSRRACSVAIVAAAPGVVDWRLWSHTSSGITFESAPRN